MLTHNITSGLSKNGFGYTQQKFLHVTFGSDGRAADVHMNLSLTCDPEGKSNILLK